MQHTASRLLAELERSDREWRFYVGKLEKRVAALEGENHKLRQHLDEVRSVTPGVKFSLSDGQQDLEPTRDPPLGLTAYANAYVNVSPVRAAFLDRQAGSPYRAQREWGSAQADVARERMLQHSREVSAQLSLASREILDQPMARMRPRSELISLSTRRW